jgi:hypothetical protein
MSADDDWGTEQTGLAGTSCPSHSCRYCLGADRGYLTNGITLSCVYMCVRWSWNVEPELCAINVHSNQCFPFGVENYDRSMVTGSQGDQA